MSRSAKRPASRSTGRSSWCGSCTVARGIGGPAGACSAGCWSPHRYPRPSRKAGSPRGSWPACWWRSSCWAAPCTGLSPRWPTTGWIWPEGTLAGVFAACSALLAPLAALITERKAAAAHLHADETSWQVFAAVQGKDSHRWWWEGVRRPRHHRVHARPVPVDEGPCPAAGHRHRHRHAHAARRAARGPPGVAVLGLLRRLPVDGSG